ncbi:peptidase S58 DmpA [Thermaerobacter marianensis DSM 12885]|uniref:Peptidase S58 DmpA n=1 Tax=Thermaerobacter marianensis (strain ATCC 700841 / DSM 12885 / JCM 10246 / 7p75a) TaxID=644966 RepID=E6SH32_THEM7|nr:P1 family peptidase [Thermaerobacter marianensis]ADU50663.1 peptidase S58 DmpA [Thermaerobacter marianensis DSM 12885]
MTPMTAMQRGPHNAITDVAGVRVGHATLVRGEGPLRPGQGPVRTGVTVILPPGDLREIYDTKFPAAAHVINGFGKALGLAQVAELGRLETPILLTSTLSIWRAADALLDHILAAHPDIGIRAPTVNVVAGECNDGWLNDIRGRHVGPREVAEALAAAAGGPVAEGSVGAGTGMVCYGFKGGIGTASRVWPSPLPGAGEEPITLGCLVLANFGRRRDLTIAGVPVGRLLATADEPAHEPARAPTTGGEAAPATATGGAAAPATTATPPGGPERPALGAPGTPRGATAIPTGEGGSVVVVLATDAPLTSRQLARIARRAAAGLARTGTVYWHGSGDFVLAFSTARRYPPYLPDEGAYLNPFFEAAAAATEEAVIRALVAARPMTGRDGHHVPTLPVDRVRRLLEERGILWDYGPEPAAPPTRT